MNSGPAAIGVIAGIGTHSDVRPTRDDPIFGLSRDSAEGVDCCGRLETLQQSEPANGAGHFAPQQVHAAPALANDS
jgi:hypothetical protein